MSTVLAVLSLLLVSANELQVYTPNPKGSSSTRMTILKPQIQDVTFTRCFAFADSSLLQIGADRRVMMGMPMLGMDVKGSETDTQRRRPTQIVTSVNNNRRVPKQLQSSKVVPQLNQTVAVANDNSKLPQTVSVANSNNQLLQTVSVAKDNKQSYGTVLVASDNSVTVTGSLTSGSQNAVLTSGSKGFPVRRFVITYDPNQVKYSLNTKRVPP